MPIGKSDPAWFDQLPSCRFFLFNLTLIKKKIEMIYRYYAPLQLLALFCISQYRKILPLARGPLRCGAQFGLIGQIGLKPALHRSYMGVSVHWINAKTSQRESGVLGCCWFVGSHTFDIIGGMLDTIQRDFGVKERKVVATVIDNASNFVKAFKEFGLRDAEVSH